MVVNNWSLQTLSDIFHRHQLMLAEGDSACNNNNNNSLAKLAKARLKAQRKWCGAIAALEKLLARETKSLKTNQCEGLILSAPAPVLSTDVLLARFQTGIFTKKAFNPLALMPASCQENIPTITPRIAQLPLLPNDPISQESFCLALTNSFSLVMILGKNSSGIPDFQFSFSPEIIQQTWATLRSRLVVTNHPQLKQLDPIVAQFTHSTPDYSLVTYFSHQLLENLPNLSLPEIPIVSAGETDAPEMERIEELPEVELLEALSHEIRTPLTTIRTLTRLLLKKRCQLTDNAVKRLESIDRECCEQIDRMELILRATELSKQEQQPQVSLVPMCLGQVFQQSIPRWRERARRRNVVLDVVLPPKLPEVVSHPAMLDQVLTGVMENFTRSLPLGGEVRVEVTTAGDRLKLEFQSAHESNPFKSLGQLLVFQPETGSLSLNLDVTKNLFHALGGKLTVRQRPQQGEIFTIFLPLLKNKQHTMIE